jgi:hypothetical protein
MLSKIKPAAKTRPEIKFTTKPELYGVIPEPTPATKELPTWYKETPVIEGGGVQKTKPEDKVTIRGCMPFHEAITSGWIMKTPVDIYITNQNGFLEISTNNDTIGVSSRDVVKGLQTEESDFFLTINTYWSIETSPGYSIINLPLLNKFDPRFRTMSGIIESDKFQDQHKVELLWRDESFAGCIPAGTPISQVITVERGSVNADGVVRERTQSEQESMDKYNRSRHYFRHFYRNNVWSSPKKSRKIKQEQKIKKAENTETACPFIYKENK